MALTVDFMIAGEYYFLSTFFHFPRVLGRLKIAETLCFRASKDNMVQTIAESETLTKRTNSTTKVTFILMLHFVYTECTFQNKVAGYT